MRTFKVYSLSKFQLYNTVLPARVRGSRLSTLQRGPGSLGVPPDCMDCKWAVWQEWGQSCLLFSCGYFFIHFIYRNQFLDFVQRLIAQCVAIHLVYTWEEWSSAASYILILLNLGSCFLLK